MVAEYAAEALIHDAGIDVHNGLTVFVGGAAALCLCCLKLLGC